LSLTAGTNEQRERAARNQSLFREVNERIEDLSTSASFVEFVCECAYSDCTQRINVTLEEYEEIRGDSNRFFVLPGHEMLEVEAVVDSAEDRYLVVSKLGGGAAVANDLDPRRNP
jgi:hypothetical protein